MGNAIAEEIKDAGAGYHLSGDEFAIQAGSHEEAESIMRRVHDRLSVRNSHSNCPTVVRSSKKE